MELAVAMSRREREAVGLLPADRALQLRRALGLHVGLEPLEHLGAEAAAAALGRDADIRPPAVLATTEHAAIRRASVATDRATVNARTTPTRSSVMSSCDSGKRGCRNRSPPVARSTATMSGTATPVATSARRNSCGDARSVRARISEPLWRTM